MGVPGAATPNPGVFGAGVPDATSGDLPHLIVISAHLQRGLPCTLGLSSMTHQNALWGVTPREALCNHDVRGDEVLSSRQSSDGSGFKCTIRSEDQLACPDSSLKEVVPLELDDLLEERALAKKR